MKRNDASSSLGLLTDLYQLTMAYGYWKTQRHDDDSVFHLFFRKAPFDNDFALAAGLEAVADFVESHFRFSPDDCAFLETLTGNDELPLFEAAFLDYLCVTLYSMATSMPFRKAPRCSAMNRC